MAVINGTGGNDDLPGSGSADTISGLGGNDTLTGHGGNDSLVGGAGNDALVGGAGNDTLDGGTGTDQVLYYRETGLDGVNANLGTGQVRDTYGNTDTLRGIEQFFGSVHNDTVTGSGQTDFIFGRQGNDNLLGGAGDDVLVGDQGNDTLNGGAGSDQAAYFLETGTRGINVDLLSGTAIDTWGHTDTLFGIERILGSVQGDTIRGSNSGDTLFGRQGNDTIEGRNGNDTLVGDQGADTLNGGADDDQVAYFLETGTNGVNVDMRAGTATDTWGHTDQLIGIEFIHGSNQNDTIRGTDNHGDRIFGRDGNDYMDGRDGNDLYYTGNGNDTIIVGGTIADARDTIVVNGSGTNTIRGGDSEGTRFGHHLVFEIDEAITVDLRAGTARSANSFTDFTQALYFLEVGGTMHDDVLVGGNPRHDYLEWYVGNQGNDTLNGGGGDADTVVYEDEVTIGSFNFRTGVHEYGTRGVVVNLTTGVAVDTFGFTDTLIEIDDVRATEFADNILGTSGANAFWGLAGNDTLDGGAGIDRVHYGEDYLHTGGRNGITVNLTTGTAIDGYGDTDRLIGIEEVYGTQYNDRITGNTEENRLEGAAGNDTLTGNGGADVLVGGAGLDSLLGGDGADQLVGGAGNDILDGGAGADLIRYREAATGVVVDLAANAAQDGDGGQDTLRNIENAHGSDHNDTMRGNSGANELSGFAGNDVLQGNLGNDTLLGGDGNDNVQGGAGNDEIWGGNGTDTLNGGDGVDLVRYRGDTAGVTVNLISGQAVDGGGALDTLTSIEGAHGSDHGDRLTGNVTANELSGFAGNDVLQGNGGNDTLLGGAGNDTLQGGANNDEIWGEAGNDTIDGGDGTDLIRYRNSTAGAVVDLAAGQAQDGFGGTDSLSNVENAHGSDHGDSLRGNGAANELSGFGGNDTILGFDGADTLLGGDGNDSILGGTGNDEIWGNAGNDTLDGGAGDNDLLRYRNDSTGVSVDLIAGTASDGDGGTDSISNIEDVHTSDHDDLVRGSNGANRLFGFAGDDTLRGEGGNDVLLADGGEDVIEGGAGDDEIWGGSGDDTLDGGTGSDLVRYLDAIGGVNVNLSTGLALDGFGSRDTLSNIENVHGSNFSDSLTGDSGGNRLFGFAGRDSLQGEGGNDTMLGGDANDVIRGGDGNDEIWGEAGDDTIYGGAGNDLVRFRGATSGLNVNLILETATGEGNDQLHGVEHIDGSDHNDLIIGNNLGNTLSGFGGADTIIGGAGNDTLAGRQGGDRYEFIAGDGYDIVNDLGDGTGTDRVVFHDYFARNATISRQNPSNEAIVINFGATMDIVVLANSLNAGHASAIEQIEWADGTVWSHAQLIAALGQTGTVDSEGPTHQDNLLNRTPNDDVTDALGGNDLVRGLGGDDSLSGSDGNDTLEGGEGDDTLMGGNGNDTLEGGPGNDVKDGGAGSDTAIYTVTLDDATVTYRNGTFTISSHLGTDTVTNVETFRFADRTLSLSEMIAIGENAAPTSTLPATLTSIEGEISVNFAQYFTDPEGQTLTYEIHGLPEGLSVSSSGLVVTGTAEAALTPFTVDITAHDPLNGSVTGTIQWTIQNVNAAPTGGVTIQGTATEGELLTAVTDTLADADGLGQLEFIWTRDGTAISGATSSTYQLGVPDIGARIAVQVRYTDGFGTDETVNATATDPVANINYATTGVVDIEGRALQGQTVTAVTGTLADDDGLGALSYQWLRDGSPIEGATNVSYLLTGADVDREISVRVSHTDQQGTPESVTSSTVTPEGTGNNPHTGTVTISGSNSQGSTLSAQTSGLADEDGLGSFSYQWLRDGAAIDGANGATYTLVTADIGARIAVRVSFVDGRGTTETQTSAATSAISDTNDAPEGQPEIEGTPTQGQTLTVDTSDIEDEDGIGDFSFQWLRDGAAISGATDESYTLVQADVGTSVSVRVSYTDQAGTDETVTSSGTSSVANVNDPATGRPVITGTVDRGEVLSVDLSGIVEPDGIASQVFYEWNRDGTFISGQRGETYTVTPADDGAAISVTIYYTDGSGTQERLTSETVMSGGGNTAPTGLPVISGSTLRDGVLSVDVSSIADADGIATRLFYEWYRDGTFISGQRSETYTVTPDDDGAEITVQVYYTDGGGAPERLTSAPVTGNSGNQVATGGPVINGSTLRDGVLTVDVSSIADGDGIASRLFYEWYRDGTFITGQRGETYTVTPADDGAAITVQVYFTDTFGNSERLTSAPVTGNSGNQVATGTPVINGTFGLGETLSVDTSGIADGDGIASRIFFEWQRDGTFITGQRGSTYTLTSGDLGSDITVRAYFTDGFGNSESLISAPVSSGGGVPGQTLTGTAGNDRLVGDAGNDSISGLAGNDTLIGQGGSDTLNGADGADILNGGDGDDFIFGGATEADLRDVVYGGAGHDSIDGGYGNDELRGDAGNDTILGGFGVDNVLGGDGDDQLTGQAWSDAIFGGNGNDFINGGFGHDRLNGGAGGDRFFHIGVADHGSDWIQDYNAAQGDVLHFGGSAAAADFQVNYTETANAGVAGVEEAFIIYRPTNQIIWALVDGGGQSSINLVLGTQTFDLLA